MFHRIFFCDVQVDLFFFLPPLSALQLESFARLVHGVEGP